MTSEYSLCPDRNSCSDLASKCRSNSSPRDTKETELFEDRLGRDALDLGLTVMRERDGCIEFSLFEDDRDLAAQVLPHVLTLVQHRSFACRSGLFRLNQPRSCASVRKAGAIFSLR